MLIQHSALIKIAKIWQLQLNIEYCEPKKNVRLSFKDIGSFCEHLAIDYYEGYTGSGSGGMGLDLSNRKTKKSIEVKSCCTIQNSKCLNCNGKYNTLFLDFCPQCYANDYKEISDSRFSINAKELLDQINEGIFENITLCHILLDKMDRNEGEIDLIMLWYRIDFSDDDIRSIQLEYFNNQVAKGKANTCNLLPNSFDFYKLCPIQFSATTVKVNYVDINKTPEIHLDNTIKKLTVPEYVIPRNSINNFKKLITYKAGYADAKDFTMHIDYKKKNLGKERGDTRTNVYKKLK